MEDDKYGFSYEEEVRNAVQKFEKMKRNNEKFNSGRITYFSEKYG